MLPARKGGPALLSAGTKRTAAQRDEGEAREHDGPDVQWTAAGSHVAAARDILAGDEAEAVLAKRARGEDDGGEGEGPDDGLYRGQKAYARHVRREREVPKTMRAGPVRASGSTIRTVTIVDYQPDVCKDYKGASGAGAHRWQDGD